MPIHFRCAHCEKLLGIARRKAGSIVNCPQCEQPLIVPTPEPGEADPPADPDASTHHSDMRTSRGEGEGKPKKAGGNKLFEADEIDRLLEQSLSDRTKSADGPKAPRPAIVPQAAFTSNGMPAPLPAPIPAPMPVAIPTAGGLSIGKILALLLIVFALVTGAFVAGIFVGRGSP